MNLDVVGTLSFDPLTIESTEVPEGVGRPKRGTVMDYYVPILKINIFFPLYLQHLRHGTFRSGNQVDVMFHSFHDHYSSMSCINISDCVRKLVVSDMLYATTYYVTTTHH